MLDAVRNFKWSINVFTWLLKVALYCSKVSYGDLGSTMNCNFIPFFLVYFCFKAKSISFGCFWYHKVISLRLKRWAAFISWNKGFLEICNCSFLTQLPFLIFQYPQLPLITVTFSAATPRWCEAQSGLFLCLPLLCYGSVHVTTLCLLNKTVNDLASLMCEKALKKKKKSPQTKKDM